VPRPQSSILYTVSAPTPDLLLAKGDYLVVERDRAMRSGRLMLITVGGEFRLAEIRREGGRFSFDDMPEDDFDS
jgi:SOS-response transcriptional repressor LexA